MRVTTQRRSSYRATPRRNTQVTETDVRSYCEPLTRYARLPTSYLIHFRKDDTNLQDRRNRLTDLFHDHSLFVRSEERRRFGGQNGQAQYQHNPKVAEDYLSRLGLFDHLTEHWMEKARIGPKMDDHDFYLNLDMANIELAAKERFINHHALLRVAPEATQTAADPMIVPANGDLTYKHYPSVQNPRLEPDAIAAIDLGNADHGGCFEKDRGNEVIEPTKKLVGSSILKKLLLYEALEDTIQHHFNFPDEWRVFFICHSKTRMAEMMALVEKHLGKSRRYCFIYDPPPTMQFPIPPVSDFLFTTPWKRVGYSDLTLNQPERR